MQPVQLRLGFAQPSRPVTLHLILAGSHVLVETEPDREQEAWSYLSASGANPTIGQGRGLSFPVSLLHALAELPAQARCVPDAELRTLYQLVLHPSADNRPAELSTGPDGSLWMSWFDGSEEYTELFPTAAAVALLTADLPFVATAEAFDTLRTACSLPLLAGRCRVNLDGFIEIITSKPQLVESAPLPGLFRIEETRFGLALAYAPALTRAPGFIWEGHKPMLDRGPAELPQLPMDLSAHARADLRTLVDQLAAYRAQAIVWSPGLGRRVFALAAMEALDAWPLLIVCTPATVWAWQRHVEMFGRTAALTHLDADVHIVTYHDLPRRVDVGDPQAVIFDDLGSPQTLTPETRLALRRLESFADTYRVAISAQWPTEPAALVEAMSVLRPGEFRPDMPLAVRYPTNPAARLAEHVAVYTSARALADPGRDTTEFRRSSVVTTDMSAPQRVALAEAAARMAGGASAAILLAETLEIVSAGPPLSLSPKIPAVLRRAADALDAGRRVAVLTRHRRTVTLVRATLRSTDAVTVEASAAVESGCPQARLVIIRFDRELPDLSWFDDVLVVDYPWSTELLESAVGPASGRGGPLQVTLFHLTGSIDDRLAMLAARRREMGVVIDHSAPPSDAEIDYLLAARD
jgi:hypothetical protein